MPASGYRSPGRLSDPTMLLTEDPRLDPRLRAILCRFGMDRRMRPPSVTEDSPTADVSAWMAKEDSFAEKLYRSLPLDLSTDAEEPEIDTRIETLRVANGHSIKLHIFRPSLDVGTLPCVVYMHGGGMVNISTSNPVHMRWCKSIAATGLVAIAVDFRNAWEPAKANPFPTGLNDCAAAVQWIHANRTDLGISKIILQGESGGGNLACATAIKANREGWVRCIDGVFALVPYVSGAYGWSTERKLQELPSLVECDGYILGSEHMAISAHWYGPEDGNAVDALAWPYHALESDLKGLPPHVIIVDELDPLKDEGMAYYQKLRDAGVDVVGKMNLGVFHAAEMAFRQTIPNVYSTTVNDIAAFAKSDLRTRDTPSKL